MNLPTPKDQPDFSLLSSPEGEFWIAYELPRDFLSAPRQFAIITGSLGPLGQLILLQPPQAEQVPNEEFFVEEDGVCLFTLANAEQELKLCADEIRLIERFFHPQGPQAALLASIGAQSNS